MHLEILVWERSFTLLFSSGGRREWSGDTCVDIVFSTIISVELIMNRGPCGVCGGIGDHVQCLVI